MEEDIAGWVWMMQKYSDYLESSEYIAARIGDFRPDVLLILGSGLGFLADMIEQPLTVDYADIPHMRTSTAPGHRGRFVMGMLSGQKVAVMQGRLHCYEGYSMEEVVYPLRVMRLLGAGILIVTNAAGCVNTSWKAGDLMLITDHIRLFGFGPLCGPNIEEFGPRFNDMSAAYDEALAKLACSAALEAGITLREGVYMYFPGPSFETPSEVRAARILGADAVGMSTVPEVTAAAHCGMKVLGVSLLTNMAAGIAKEALSAEEVERTAEASKDSFAGLILSVLALI